MVWQIQSMNIGLEMTEVWHAWLPLKKNYLHFKYLKLFVGSKEEMFLFFWPAFFLFCFWRVVMPQLNFFLKGLEAAPPRLWLQSLVGLLKTWNFLRLLVFSLVATCFVKFFGQQGMLKWWEIGEVCRKTLWLEFQGHTKNSNIHLLHTTAFSPFAPLCT